MVANDNLDDLPQVFTTLSGINFKPFSIPELNQGQILKWCNSYCPYLNRIVAKTTVMRIEKQQSFPFEIHFTGRMIESAYN